MEEISANILAFPRSEGGTGWKVISLELQIVTGLINAIGVRLCKLSLQAGKWISEKLNTMYYHLFCNSCLRPLVGFTCCHHVHSLLLHVTCALGWLVDWKVCYRSVCRHIGHVFLCQPTGVFALVLSHFIALSNNFIQYSFCILHVSM
jgi:hypothetical protein